MNKKLSAQATRPATQGKPKTAPPPSSKEHDRQAFLALTLVERLLQRIGYTANERLEWAVQVVQMKPHDMTPGDWESLREELAGFIMQIHHSHSVHEDLYMVRLDRLAAMTGIDASTTPAAGSVNPGREATPDVTLNEMAYRFRVSHEDAKEMLTRMRTIIEAAVKRQPVTLFEVRSPGKLQLLWDSKTSKWLRVMKGKETAADIAARILGLLLEKLGDLLKECPAPRPRDEKVCGRWFVGTRPSQEYCSATCQSRAAMRASRAGVATPAMQRRKAEKEG